MGDAADDLYFHALNDELNQLETYSSLQSNQGITLSNYKPYADIIRCDNEGVPVIKISKDGFYYNGERVDDVNDVYTKFYKYLNRTV